MKTSKYIFFFIISLLVGYIIFSLIIVYISENHDYQSRKIFDLSQNQNFTVHPKNKEGTQFHYKVEGYSDHDFKIKYYFFNSNFEKPYLTFIDDYKKGKVKFKANRSFYYSELTKGELILSGYM
jgi:hypothetical protein